MSIARPHGRLSQSHRRPPARPIYLPGADVDAGVTGCGLGLASTMSINILERDARDWCAARDGASSGSILKIIVAEGAIIGALSWALAIIIAWPVSSSSAIPSV